MLHQIGLVLFAVAAGFAASGIVTSLYRMVVAAKPKDGAAKAVHYLVMVVAGPNVLIENAAKSLKQKDCSKTAFWFAAIVAGYWSLMLGLFVIQIGMTF